MIRFKDDIEDAKQRIDAWWAGEVTDRAAIMVSARRKPVFEFNPIPAPDIHAWWTDPEYLISRIAQNLASKYTAAESFPVLYPVLTGLVSITCKYCGCENIYIGSETTWSKPYLKNLSGRPPIRFDENNEWWQITERLMKACAGFIREYDLECFMGLPDLNGPTEVASGIRGAQEFSIDFYDEPDEIVPFIREVQDVWFEAFRRTSAISNEFGGYFTWMGIWSELPAVDLQSDVSCLLSKAMFDAKMLPFIEEQTNAIARTVYHLDGPDAVRHLDSLLDLPNLDAIQWVQGSGAGMMSEWVDLLKRIQAGGKNLYIDCAADEVEFLMSELSSRGLLISTDCGSVEEADTLVKNVAKWTRD